MGPGGTATGTQPGEKKTRVHKPGKGAGGGGGTETFSDLDSSSGDDSDSEDSESSETSEDTRRRNKMMADRKAAREIERLSIAAAREHLTRAWAELYKGEQMITYKTSVIQTVAEYLVNSAGLRAGTSRDVLIDKDLLDEALRENEDLIGKANKPRLALEYTNYKHMIETGGGSSSGRYGGGSSTSADTPQGTPPGLFGKAMANSTMATTGYVPLAYQASIRNQTKAAASPGSSASINDDEKTPRRNWESVMRIL